MSSKNFFLFVLFLLTLFTSNSFAEFTFVQTKDVSSDTPGIRGINFKPDGTRMYITSREDDPEFKGYIIEYSLSKPFDISTATISFSGGSPKGTPLTCDGAGAADQMELPHAVEFKPDGTRMFITTNKDFSGSPGVAVYQFKLTTPWDSTTLVCEKIYEVDVDGSGNEDQVRVLDFNPDGTRMFVGGKRTHKLRQYDLATPFDLRSGVTPGGISDSLESFEDNMRDIQFNPDGTQMFLTGDERDSGLMQKFSLSTPYDITTLSSTTETFSLTSPSDANLVNNLMGFIFAVNFTKIFVTSDDGNNDDGGNHNQIHEFDIDCAGTITCADPSANADVKAIIEANVESAKRIIRNNTLPIFHRTEWLRRHKNKDNLSNLNAEIDFTNQKIAKLASALNILKKEKDRTYSSDDWFEWSEGRIGLGKKDANDASSRDIHSYGFSIGADRIKKNDRDSMYGYVFQYGNDDVDIGGNGTNLNTDSYSIALYDTKLKDDQFIRDSVIGLSLQHIDHKRVINDNNALALEVSKSLQYLKLNEAGIKTPKSIFCSSKSQIIQAAKNFSKPFITKHNRAGRGLGVQLFNNKEELEEYVNGSLFENSIDGITILQDYIDADPKVNKQSVDINKAMLAGFGVNKREFRKKQSPWNKFEWNNPFKPYEKKDVKSKATEDEDDLSWLL